MVISFISSIRNAFKGVTVREITQALCLLIGTFFVLNTAVGWFHVGASVIGIFFSFLSVLVLEEVEVKILDLSIH